MDNPEKFRVLEWCAGYGGIGLGLKRAIPNMLTVAFSEIEAYACANLVAKMEAGLLDSAPIWTDIKTFPNEEFRGKIDMLIAGYPCQPFSAAGKRLGTEDPRHLWPHIRNSIGIIRPRFCFFENVEGHISLGLSTVLADLEEDGYTATWGIFSAEECGAPHRRKRVFILAHRDGTRLEGLRECSRQDGRQEQIGHIGSRGQVWPARPGQEQYEWEPPRVLANTTVSNDRRRDTGATERQREEHGKGCSSDRFDWQTFPPMGRDSYGNPDRLDTTELYQSTDNRTDELRLLGNGVVPDTAEIAFRILYNRIKGQPCSTTPTK